MHLPAGGAFRTLSVDRHLAAYYQSFARIEPTLPNAQRRPMGLQSLFWFVFRQHNLDPYPPDRLGHPAASSIF